MGESTFIENNRPTSRSPFSNLPVDIPLVATVFILAVFGIIMVYSSSWYASLDMNENTYAIAARQAQWLALGMGTAIIAYFFNYHYYRKFLIVMVIVTMGALLAVLLLGNTKFGANRTLTEGGSVQPSELAKLVVIIYLSYWLHNRRDTLNNVTLGLIPLGIIIGLFGGLTVLQPDLSAAFTIVFLGFCLFFLADANPKQIVLLMVVSIIAAALAISISTTGQKRISDYISGLRNPAEASEQVLQSFQSIPPGGLFGVGIGKGSTKNIDLPLPWTDSIFAVIAEETGLVGCCLVIFLYMVILWRGIKISREAPDQLGKLLAGGITIWITWEAILNMGVMVGLIPVTGNALPFISAGGSSLVSLLTGVGILANVSRTKHIIPNAMEGRSNGAAVDLRWRDRGRRESRSRRSASYR